MEMPSLLCEVTKDSPFAWPRGWFNFIRYHRGLIVFLFLSILGVWLLVRAIKKDTKFLNGLLKLPTWFLVASGILLQMPTAVYIYLGIKAGFFSF
jgi:hypothetical protein